MSSLVSIPAAAIVLWRCGLELIRLVYALLVRCHSQVTSRCCKRSRRPAEDHARVIPPRLKFGLRHSALMFARSRPASCSCLCHCTRACSPDGATPAPAGSGERDQQRISATMLKSLLQFDDRSPLTPIGSFPKALRGSRVLPPKPLARALTRRRQMPGLGVSLGYN